MDADGSESEEDSSDESDDEPVSKKAKILVFDFIVILCNLITKNKSLCISK